MRHPSLAPTVEDYLVIGVTTNGWPTLRGADLDRLLDNLPDVARNLGFAPAAVKGAMTKAIQTNRPDLKDRWRRACLEAREH